MIVKEIDLFKEISHEVMEEIANICSEENYLKNMVLFKKGEEADCLYILVEGSVNLVIEDGGCLVLNLTESGEIFGWSSMVEHGLYTASGVCATNIKVVKLERDKLNKIFDIHPEVGLKVLRRLAKIISERLTNSYRDLLSCRKQDTTSSYG